MRRPVFLLWSCVAVCTFAWAADADGALPGFEELHESVKKALGSGKGMRGAIQSIDGRLAEYIAKGEKGKILKDLLCIRKAAELFAGVRHRDMALSLCKDLSKCGRFIHAVDKRDDVNKALDVLSTLKNIDEQYFEKWFEFCVAYSVVWDKFRGHWWVDRREKMEDNTMENTYRFYIKHERILRFNPSNLPFELAVFVVGTRLSKEEREWIIQNYNKSSIAPGNVYRGVPWTQKLSPAHHKGKGIPYTLMNIKKMGGVCMEQAYFTENVLRIFCVPAIYTRGRGQRGGHAWVGALTAGSRNIKWNFSFGRYRYDHYFKGEVNDPTDMRHRLTDSVVKMTSAAMMQTRSITKLEDSYWFLNAAEWAGEHLPESPANGNKRNETVRDYLVASLQSNPYNGRTWMYLSELASEKKMDTKTGIFWTNKLFNITIKEFPDFTVDCLENFLQCVEDKEFKAGILGKTYSLLRKNRADLASDIKLQEGDLWIEQGKIAQGLLAYAYPLVNFSKDTHVLDRAKEKINDVDKKVDAEKLEKGYVTLVNSIRRMRNRTKEARDICDLILKRLVALYKKKNDTRKAQYYRSLIGKN